MYGVPDAMPWSGPSLSFNRPVFSTTSANELDPNSSRAGSDTGRSNMSGRSNASGRTDSSRAYPSSRSRSSIGDYSSRTGQDSSRSYSSRSNADLFGPRVKSSFELLGDDLAKGGSFIPKQGMPGYASSQQRYRTIKQSADIGNRQTTVYDDAGEDRIREDRYRRRLQNRTHAEDRIAKAYDAEEVERLRKEERTISGKGRMKANWEKTIKEREARLARAVRKRPMAHDGHTLYDGNGPLDPPKGAAAAASAAAYSSDGLAYPWAAGSHHRGTGALDEGWLNDRAAAREGGAQATRSGGSGPVDSRPVQVKFRVKD